MIEQLRQHFQTLGLPYDAAEYLLDLWNMIQVWDDAADGDKADPQQVTDAVWASLVKIPLNPFYAKNAGALVAIVGLQVLKWKVCNEREAVGLADAKTYMWRAGYYDVVLAVCQMCGLCDKLALVPDLYGETLGEYLREYE